MKRILVGAGWFLVLWFGIDALGGAIAGGMAGAHAGPDAFEAGRRAGEAFGARYGSHIMLASLAVSVLGTWRRLLPGTSRAS